MANSIVREREAAGGENTREIQGGARGKVVAEIMADITPWRDLRDADFEALWDEYYAKWRGFWMPEHKSYKTERSKLIAPLTSMAIDLTTAEILEALFGREYFVDIPDDLSDEAKDDVAFARQRLCRDLRDEGLVDEMAAVVLNGCLYGTGIMKIAVNTKIKRTPFRTEEGKLEVAEEEIVDLCPVAIEPGAFVADPACRDIDDMKGCAHEFELPLHTIVERQNNGSYHNDIVIGAWNARTISPNRGDTEVGNMRIDNKQTAYITEYYGLVPTRLYMEATAEANGTKLSEKLIEGIPSGDMTECIVTIANETHLLRIIESPLLTRERLVFAYQHETVPNRFYGRGVAEKGSNTQRAMDAEMRARIDALAWSNKPMFAGDLTRMPPNANLNAWPGKFWGTRGNPAEVLQEFRISGPDANSYQHMQDLERMGQQATGALDSSMLRQGMRDETATGSALGASSFIKRSRRTMHNIEGFMNRFVKRIMHLKMQFDPQRYPNDYEFSVRGTMGIMAREIEQQFMVNLVSVLGPQSPATQPIIKAIFEHSGTPVKAEVLAQLKALEEKEPTEEEQAAQAAALELPVAELDKIKAETAKLIAEAGFKDAQEDKTEAEIKAMAARGDLEALAALNDIQETDNQKTQIELQAEKNDIERAKLMFQKSEAAKSKP